MNLFAQIDDATLQRMKFRRQFVLAPRKLEKFGAWNTRTVGGKWVIHSHPDLGLTQTKHESMEVTLLGYFLNPDKPEQTDHDICTWLIKDVTSIDEFIDKTRRLVGRWVLFFFDGRDLFCFRDVCGMRTLHYVETSDGPWCFSQPEAVKDLLNLGPNREAIKDFFPTSYYLNNVEYWWPGYDTPYEGVKNLPVNHYLNLRSVKLTRFWPRKKNEPRTMAQALPETAQLFRGIFAAAARRFPLALPITAGWDSRVLLAASKPFGKDIFYYTLKYNSLKQDERDLEIPPRLLAKLGLPHHLIECPAGVAKQFGEIYFGNVGMANYAHGPIIFGLFLNYPQERVCLKGMGNEVARCFFYRKEHPKSVDADLLTLCAQGWKRQNDYAKRHFERWLKEVQPAADACSYKILDLFHWEQKVANLVATFEGECDLVYETMAPYNCRALLEIMLSVPGRFRADPDYIFYEKLINELWSEALLEPINPSPLSERVQTKVDYCKTKTKSALGRLGLLDTAKKIYHRRKAP